MRYASLLAVLVVTLGVSTANAIPLGLGPIQTDPDLNVTGIVLSYVNSTDTLSVTSAMPMYIFMPTSGSDLMGMGVLATDFKLEAFIDASGNLLAGPSTLTVSGMLGMVNGPLLTATITDFGFEVSPGGDMVSLEFLANVTFQNLPESIGPIIGIIVGADPGATPLSDPPFTADFAATTPTFDAFAVIPSPAAAGVGLLSFVLLALGRRRSLA